jgi:hypothetical protein
VQHADNPSRTTIYLLAILVALAICVFCGLAASAIAAGRSHGKKSPSAAACSSASHRGARGAGHDGRRRSKRACPKPRRKASGVVTAKPSAPEGTLLSPPGAASASVLTAGSQSGSPSGSGSTEGTPGSEGTPGTPGPEGTPGSSSGTEGVPGPSEGSGNPVEPPAPFRFFSPTSFWNEPLTASAPLEANSAQFVSQLDAEVAAEEQTKKGPSINTTSYSVPIYTVPANQPTVRVQLVNHAPEPPLQTAWSAVPLPPGAQPAAGTDASLVVWQPSTDRMWEFWLMAHEASGWQAQWGGAMQHVSSNPGVYGTAAWSGATPLWGASASSLALAGGLITLEDLKLGEINHALGLALPERLAGIYSAPAKRTDGKSANPLSLPEGAHLRLNPNLNLAALHLPRVTLMIARAAQRYGIFIRDGAGSIAFYAQDPTPTGTNPYTGPGGYFEGSYPSKLLSSFPWSELELLKMELHSSS